MEKYNEVIKQIKKIRGFKEAFNIKYDECMDSVLLTFYNMKAYRRLDNENTKAWKAFESVCCMCDVNYEFKSYGEIELYF